MSELNHRLYIVEGPDGSGKSTVARELCRRTGSAYMHMSGHPSLHTGMQAYHLEALADARVNIEIGRPVVIDRHWPSELCYGATLRPAVTKQHYNVKMIQDALDKFPEVIYIFCDRFHIKPEAQYLELNHPHSFNVEQFAEIIDAYQHLMEAFRNNDHFNSHMFDRDMMDLDPLLNKILC